MDEDGKPALDPQALTEVLSFYQRGIESGAILTDVLEYETVENCWHKYLQAEVVMSNISSKLYLAGRGLLAVSRATAVPTRDGQAIALSEGYAWAMTTRRAASFERSMTGMGNGSTLPVGPVLGITSFSRVPVAEKL